MMITVNALSKHAGVSAHTVRCYSRIGLLNPRRDPNGASGEGNTCRVIDAASEALRTEACNTVEEGRYV